MAADEQVEQLVAVTGVSKEMATNLLEACGGNLEMAVNMHMEDQGGGDGAPVAIPPQEGEEEVRAPIPQHQEMMIQPGYEGYALASRQRGASATRRVGTVRSVFDGFRDFEAETRRMEANWRIFKRVLFSRRNLIFQSLIFNTPHYQYLTVTHRNHF